ncbi:MAG TPA: hypothetical protein DD417_02915 [Elusimicrobia bacterium]|nr:hypothetical protein [Elusimicrobiota bacterium]
MPPMPFTTPKSNEAQVSQAGESLVKSLEMVARILSSYMGLRLVPFYYLQKHGEDAQNTPRQWRTVLQMEEIQYLPEDLADKDRNVSLGRLAHEIWHLLFSRPELIFDHPEFEDDMAFQALWWAVEDPRVNNLGMAEHPGAKAWIDAAYAKDFAIQDIDLERAQWSQIPLHLQFNYGLIYQWWSGKSDPRITDARVLDALKRARPAIRKAAEESDAARAFELVRDEIWPIYKELLDEAYEQAMKDKARQKQEKQQGEKSEEQDEDQQGQGQGQGEQGEEKESDQDQDGGQGKPGKPKPGKQGKPGQKQDQPLTDEERQKVEKQVKEEMRKKEKEFRDKHSSKMVDQKDKMSDAEKEKRRKEMEELRKKLDKARQKGQPQKGKPQDGKPQDGQPQDGESADGAADKKNEPDKKLSEKQKQRLNKADEEKKDLRNEDHERYRKYFDRVRQLVPVMRHQFMETLKQKIRRRTLRGRDSGDLDPDALHLLPSGNKDVFVEEFMPNKTLYRISLLIDTSGSMSGDKKERAIEGAIMMMEALDKVPGVVFEIVKYDSDPKVLKPFNVKLTPKMKEGIVSSIHSGSGSTEAFNALKEAIERVRQGRGDKMVIMVNDGDPDYNFDRDAYRAMVKAAKDVEIHGIGLGDGAQLVLDLFPPGQGHWVKDAADFAKNLRSILRKKLLGK